MRGREGLAERLAQQGADTNVAIPSPDRTIIRGRNECAASGLDWLVPGSSV